MEGLGYETVKDLEKSTKTIYSNNAGCWIHISRAGNLHALRLHGNNQGETVILED